MYDPASGVKMKRKDKRTRKIWQQGRRNKHKELLDMLKLENPGATELTLDKKRKKNEKKRGHTSI
ncbi:unnamed protein product [marine sediment metagenome]|uniref:Uncharacterized protein n=1 Tax=marine sediment metagenome TaxID=412755 RepID=X1NVT2_9ZZZZ